MRPTLAALCAALVSGLLASACSDAPTRPTPDPGGPALTCPAPVTVLSPDNQPMAVTYQKPSIAGGLAPVVTTCTPETTSVFPLGTTTVTCRSTDAQNRTGSCSFGVTVQASRVLRASRLLAFGDSITEGKTAAGLLGMTAVGCPIPDRPTSYPRVLGELLRAIYPTQTITSTNCGVGRETAMDGAERLPSALALTSPDVLLVMQGANDLNAISVSGGTRAMAVAQVSDAIVSMIRQARGGRTVFVGTLPPQRSGGKASRPDWVEPVNNQLRSVVPSEGAVLVDIYRALGSSPDPYIDTDGLHPTVDGHRTIAEAFRDAIVSRLEGRP